MERFYRNQTFAQGLFPFNIQVGESDIMAYTKRDFSPQIKKAVEEIREKIFLYATKNPRFLTSLTPIIPLGREQEAILNMMENSRLASVGPMATVAGEVNDFIYKNALYDESDFILENGGDVLIKTSQERHISLFAGENNPFTGKVSLKLKPKKEAVGVCASSSYIGHSISFGECDLAVVLAKTSSLADAFATKTANSIKSAGDIAPSLEDALKTEGIIGVVAIKGESIGAMGEIEFV